ncbi:MAG: DUF885 domain-containing protein [Lachnospiraceae bacterium]|nr:DUF885 domain-containing protein [Lachnospiraceae bacterium]
MPQNNRHPGTPSATASSASSHVKFSCSRRSRFGAIFRSLRPALFAAILTLLLCHLITHPPSVFLTEEQRFAAFTEEVFREELSGNTLNLHYLVADPSAYGLEDATVSLGNASTEAREASCATLENYRSSLLKFDYEKLSEKRQLTYDVFLSYLETELEAADLLLYDEPLGPMLGVQAQLPILLAEYAFRTKGDIEDYLTLLTQIPDYFDSLLSFEQEKSAAGLFMSSACALEVIEQCLDFAAEGEDHYLIAIFDEKIDKIANLTTDEKIAYKTRNQAILTGYVLPAYQTLAAGLAALEDTGKNEMGLYYYPDGQEYYKYLVKSTVGDNREIEEIEEEIKTQMVADYAAMQELLAPSEDSGDDSSSETAAGATRILPEAESTERSYVSTFTSDDPASMLEDLRAKITGDFPLLPSVSCEIKYVHESLQEYLSPAFYLSPPIDDFTSNVIYINPANGYSGIELYTTLAHEGYPGHLYQSVYFLSQTPDLLRTLLDIGGYTEGWATYVEMYAYALCDEDRASASISQRNRSFTLGLASLLDIGIHYRGYTRDEVAAFLSALGFSESTADALYTAILESPANYLQYYVGYLDFCSLRDTLEAAVSDFSLKKFHQAVLETGPVPFDLLREQCLKKLTGSDESKG